MYPNDFICTTFSGYKLNSNYNSYYILPTDTLDVPTSITICAYGAFLFVFTKYRPGFRSALIPKRFQSIEQDIPRASERKFWIRPLHFCPEKMCPASMASLKYSWERKWLQSAHMQPGCDKPPFMMKLAWPQSTSVPKVPPEVCMHRTYRASFELSRVPGPKSNGTVKPGPAGSIPINGQNCCQNNNQKKIFMNVLYTVNGIHLSQKISSHFSGNLSTQTMPSNSTLPDIHAVQFKEMHEFDHIIRNQIGVDQCSNAVLIVG